MVGMSSQQDPAWPQRLLRAWEHRRCLVCMQGQSVAMAASAELGTATDAGSILCRFSCSSGCGYSSAQQPGAME